MTSAYGVFANEGVRNPYISILKIENAKGEILEEASYHPEQVLSTETSDKITDILADNVARTPLYGATSPLYFKDRPVAAKTGTKYYFPWCSGASRISEANKVWFDSYEAAQKTGLTAAANCPNLK